MISIAVVSKTLASPKRMPGSTATASVSASADPNVTTKADVRSAAPRKAEPTVPLPAPVATVAPPVASAEATTVASARATSAAEKNPELDDGDAKPALSVAEVAALKKEVESLLNRGRNKEAEAKARVAIQSDPTDAMLYLYLGSALQETGHWKNGVAAYSECVRHATKGPISECRQMGGHK